MKFKSVEFKEDKHIPGINARRPLALDTDRHEVELVLGEVPGLPPDMLAVCKDGVVLAVVPPGDVSAYYPFPPPEDKPDDKVKGKTEEKRKDGGR